jgi:sulfate transport system permease protein
MGIVLLYLGLLVLLPLAAVFAKSFELSAAQFLAQVSAPRVLASLRLTFGAAFLAAALNTIFGLLIAWVLTRYQFPGHRLVDALIDLPFALPTAVAGIALTAVYAPNGFFGAPLQALGIKIAFVPAGVVVALIFIGLPFVVRTVQPVLAEADFELEEAARLLAGNIPMVSEITPLVIITKLEQYDYAGATAVAVVMLLISFVLLLIINLLQGVMRRRNAQERPVA